MQTISYIQDIKYVTDMTGKRREVIVPCAVWDRMLAELEALREKQGDVPGLQKESKEVKQPQNGEFPEETLEDFIHDLHDYSNRTV